MNQPDQKQIPTHARSLGVEFLSYVLNVPNDEMELLLSNGEKLNKDQYAVALWIDALVLDAKKQRQNNQVLDVIDTITLRNLRLQNGSPAFAELFKVFNPPEIVLDASDDPVLLPLLKMGLEEYPFTLLPVQSNVPHPFPMISSFFGCPLQREFQDAVLVDKDLSKLFPSNSESEQLDRLNIKSEIFTSLGSGGTVQLAMLHVAILDGAQTFMRLKGKNTVSDYLEAIKETLKIVRCAARGETAQILCGVVFDGVGLPEHVGVETSHGKLQGIPPCTAKLIPSEAHPVKVDEGSAGMMLTILVDYKIHIASEIQEWEPNIPWPVGLTTGHVDNASNEVSLIAALAFAKEHPVGARQTSFLSFDPLRTGAGSSWRPRVYSARQHVIASDEQTREIVKWANIVRAVPAHKIDLAIRRFLNAITERSDISDSLVDAVIGLENLFGAKSEIAFTIATCTARLLENKPEMREQIFSRVKKVYEARSNIVHGGTLKKSTDVHELRRDAIFFLSRCLQELFEHHPMLLKMKASERVRTIALMNDKRLAAGK